MKRNILKKAWVLILVLVILASSPSFGQTVDIENHWAKNEVEFLLSKGIVTGYVDGTFRPDKSITRAEFIRLINNVFGYEDLAEISFKDVKPTDWFYKEIQKGIAEGYINGYTDDTIKPNKPITRAEAARIIAVAYHLVNEESISAKTYKDAKDIEEWALNSISILKDKNYINGYTDGTFKPKKELTRGEAAKIICSISDEIINEEMEFSKDVSGNGLVNRSNVTLKDMTIDGDLYLTQGIGNGDINLEGVIIMGKLLIMGGGENSIHIVNSKVNEMIINKKKTNVRVVLNENTEVNSISIENNGMVVVGNKAKVNKLQTVGTSKIEVAKDGEIKELEVTSKNTQINSEGTIQRVIAKEEVKINNTVVKKNTEVKVKGSKIEEIKSETPKPVQPSAPSSGGSGGSTGGGSGGGDVPSEISEIVAVFHESPVLKNFGKVSIASIKGVSNASKFDITFKYSDGTTVDTVGPVAIDGGKTTEIYYDGSSLVTIKIYNSGGTLLHVFNNVVLTK